MRPGARCRTNVAKLGIAAQDLIRRCWSFWAIVAAFIVCGCILTRKPRKKLPTETLRPAVPETGSLAPRVDNQRGGCQKAADQARMAQNAMARQAKAKKETA
jgi:hypothetical protein